MNGIRIITEPSVYLVGRQTIADGALDAFLGDHDVSGWETDTDVAGEKLVEVAGRLCYMSFAKPRPGGNRAYIGHILDVGHGSVTEHAVFNLILAGVSRSFTHELVRHRAGFGYSQLSQRFVDEADCAFVVPPTLLRGKAEAELYGAWERDSQAGMSSDIPPPCLSEWGQLYIEWRTAVMASSAAYKSISNRLTEMVCWPAYEEWVNTLPDDTLSNGYRLWKDDLSPEQRTGFRKQAREAARSVLPNATETKIFVTANARALRTFLEQRGDAAADAEMRRAAVAICRLMQREAPSLLGDFRVGADESRGEFLTCEHHKV